MELNDIILPLHILILIITAWTIFHADHLGFKWIRGNVRVLDEKLVRTYHRRIWIGLIGMIVTGVLMFLPMREYLLGRWQFLLKAFFVVALLANGFVIGSIQKLATRKAYSELTTHEKTPLFISGAVSSIGWAGAVCMAFFIVEDF